MTSFFKSPRFVFMLSVCAAALAGCQAETGTTPGKTESPQAAVILTPENLHANPSINGPSLRYPALSPDGSVVTVLQGRAENAAQQDLWAYDLKTGEGHLLVSSTDLLGAPETLSAEEKNRRERAREYGRGIVAYNWAGADKILFPLGGDIYLYDLSEKRARQVTATKGFETDAKVSPGGGHVAYVRGDNLYVADLSTGLERQLTDGATETVRNAVASFVVQEELARRTGYWWSSDDKYLAYTQIDERNIAIENRIEFGAGGVENIAQRYPFAGTRNVTIKLAITPRRGGASVWADIGDDPDVYLTRAVWSADGSKLYAGILSRDHKSHKILSIDPLTGASTLLYEDTSPTWVNVRSAFTALPGGGLLFSSEKNDLRQIFKLSDAGVLSPITPQGMLARQFNCVDDTKVYFTGWKDSPLESHIFSVDLTGENLAQLSKGEGWHSASFAKNCARYVGRFATPNTPPQIRAFDKAGVPLAWLNENALNKDHPYGPFLDAHVKPEFGQIPAEDGTPLDYALYKPKDMAAGEKRPAITIVYGGPYAQRVSKTWGRSQFANMLAQQGYVVFQLDNRGAFNRGKKFEDPLYRAMGRAEVVDQSAGAKWLAAQDFVDADNMGVYGWSYGGYMTLHMLAQTDLYKSGVSGAPVTDWTLYDTAYTERYLGDPNPGAANYTEGAYENGSVFPYLDGLTEPFLLMHGMADDNVVFRHSIKLMDAMQSAGHHNMRVMTYPGEKHGFRKTANKIHRDRMILDFFDETLRGE